LVKALVEGFGGGVKTRIQEAVVIPPEATVAMQRSVLANIAAKAGSTLPVLQGRDSGLPRAQPIFDVDEMRKRNAGVSRKGPNFV
jgi:hypothetical protein